MRPSPPDDLTRSSPHARDHRGPTSPSCAARCRRRRRSRCSPISRTSARSSSGCAAAVPTASTPTRSEPATRSASTATRLSSSISAAARTCRPRSRLGHFKLLKVAGAYWRGDETRRCCSASTARRWRARQSSTSTSTGSRRRRSAITASWPRARPVQLHARARRRPCGLAPARARSSAS